MDLRAESQSEILLKTVEHSIPLEILDDLCSRFIINIPESSKQSFVRICFQIELAHWFYLDFYCTDENSKLKSCGIQEFAAHVFQNVPFLQHHVHNLNQILSNWREYKQSVPTYGAILLTSDLTHVLLVQSYWAKNSWGFPKGKVNEDEKPSHCAIREVLEETGFNISSLLDENEYIESIINEQIVRLYIIHGIDKNTTFQPRTRCEIKCCEWFAIADLPSNKKDCTPKAKLGVSANAFFMVLPFIKRLKRWINDKAKGSTTAKRHRNKSQCESEGPKIKNKDGESSRKFQNNSPIRNLSGKKSDKKPHFKRQLFNNDKIEFTAPSWTNFKFNRQAILDCFN